MSHDERSTDRIPALLAALDDAGIRWLLLRGALEPLGEGRDLDLLVAPENRYAFSEVVSDLGGTALPAWLHPWHRSFRLAGEPALVLDVVTELTYNRTLRFRSDLAEGVLARRCRRDALWVPSPTDQFWTVLLHCLLDKQAVKPRRARELTTALPELQRPSQAEWAADRILPDGWSTDRLVDAVVREDWSLLAELGHDISPTPGDRRRAPAREGLFGLVRGGYSIAARVRPHRER